MTDQLVAVCPRCMGMMGRIEATDAWRHMRPLEDTQWDPAFTYEFIEKDHEPVFVDPDGSIWDTLRPPHA